MKCPVCGAAELIHGSQDIPYFYKGKKTIIPNVEGEFCPNCGEGVFNNEQGEKLNNLMLEFNKAVNKQTVDPSYIARIREKLRLDQKEAAEIFGGGVNAFSRYETGKATPPTSLMHLFKILDLYPSLLNVIVDKEDPRQVDTFVFTTSTTVSERLLNFAVEREYINSNSSYHHAIRALIVDEFQELTSTDDSENLKKKLIFGQINKQIERSKKAFRAVLETEHVKPESKTDSPLKGFDYPQSEYTRVIFNASTQH